MSQWVQSKYSKDAKKWEVAREVDDFYFIKDDKYICTFLKDEYVPCDPPEEEEWVTITRDAAEVDGTGGMRWLIPPLISMRWAWSEKDPDALVIQKRTTTS